MTNEVVLIDLSSIAHPIWHISQSEPDANATSQKIVARVRVLADGHPHVAICCDSGRSFRRDISTSYKANRPESDASLQHQIMLAREALEGDGFPVWAAPGCEADDLIATAVVKTLAMPDLAALVVSADKDLLQLVGPRVRAMSSRDGSIFDSAAVFAKFGVQPEQMRDYLTLVGDASDNIKGADGIGPKKAAALLAKFQSLDEIYRRLSEVGGAAMGLPPALVTALTQFQPNMATARALVTLKSDCDIPFEQIALERVPKDVATFGEFGAEDDELEPEPATAAPGPALHVVPSASAAPASDQPAVSATATGLAVREADAIIPAPADYERQLDPRSMRDAIVLAKNMYESRMFSDYGTPQAVLSTVMVGRELGLPAMASLRTIHNIKGKHALAASLMVALVLKSGFAEYFEPIEFDETHATFETKRKVARNPVRLTHTIAMAVTAGLVKADSNWVKVPTDMLVARAQSRLARMVYPDLLAGLYTPDELAELREQVA